MGLIAALLGRLAAVPTWWLVAIAAAVGASAGGRTAWQVRDGQAARAELAHAAVDRAAEAKARDREQGLRRQAQAAAQTYATARTARDVAARATTQELARVAQTPFYAAGPAAGACLDDDGLRLVAAAAGVAGAASAPAGAGRAVPAPDPAGERRQGDGPGVERADGLRPPRVPGAPRATGGGLAPLTPPDDFDRAMADFWRRHGQP